MSAREIIGASWLLVVAVVFYAAARDLLTRSSTAREKGTGGEGFLVLMALIAMWAMFAAILGAAAVIA